MNGNTWYGDYVIWKSYAATRTNKYCWITFVNKLLFRRLVKFVQIFFWRYSQFEVFLIDLNNFKLSANNTNSQILGNIVNKDVGRPKRNCGLFGEHLACDGNRSRIIIIDFYNLETNTQLWFKLRYMCCVFVLNVKTVTTL